jgi:hypothetical protein
MRIAVLAFGSLVNYPHSESEVYGAAWEVKKPKEGRDLPPKGIDFAPDSKGREILPLLRENSVLLRNTQAYIRDLPCAKCFTAENFEHVSLKSKQVSSFYA